MVETWVDLLAVVDGQLKECELRQESMEARASAASTVELTESADRSAGRGELVDQTVQPTATVTGLNEHEATELSTASDENDGINEGIGTEFRNLELHMKMVDHETCQNKLSVWHKDYRNIQMCKIIKSVTSS
jgi:hypothetical protein